MTKFPIQLLSNETTISLTYKHLILFLTFISSLFIGSISYIFYDFNSSLTGLQKSINVMSVQHLKQSELLEKLSAENLSQASKIFLLEKELLTASAAGKSPIFLSTISPDLLLKVLLVLLTVFFVLFSGTFLLDFFWKKTFVGKLLGGVNSVACKMFDYSFSNLTSKITEIRFDEYNLVLKIDVKSNNTCAITFREGSDTFFLPFERFLEKYQSALNSVEVQRITESLAAQDISGVTTAISQSIVSSPSLLFGLEAYQAVVDRTVL